MTHYTWQWLYSTWLTHSKRRNVVDAGGVGGDLDLRRQVVDGDRRSTRDVVVLLRDAQDDSERRGHVEGQELE